MNFPRMALAAGLVTLAFAASAQQAQRKTYIVQLVDAPAVGYTGTVSGLAATKPAAGRRLNVNASHVQAYVAFLDSQRNSVLSAVSAAPVVYRYRYSFNGFAVKLTDAELLKLRGTAGVKAITLDEPRQMDTSRTPAFLGVSNPGGLWSKLDAAARNVKGEDVVIGVVDSGVWPENPSVSDKVDGSGKPVASHLPGTVVYNPLPSGRYTGICEAGAGFTAAMCNNKLVGARAYRAGFDASGLTNQPGEYNSARDSDGHGSHTSSTAGGNAGADAFVQGVQVGPISGIAPRARIAAYKVCWSYIGSDLGTCFPSDSVAAIDQAVADGVDVINFSISGSQTSFLDSVEVAFLFASGGGVFVAASAGNSGPGNQVAHISPWLTTVGASTHDRLTIATATLGNGATYTGPSRSTGLASKPLIESISAALPGVPAAAAALCFLDSLDPAKVAGKIVVCDRGTNARTDKSLEVARRGGLGMILTNVTGGATDLADDAHSVPSVHLPSTDRAAIRAYAAGAGATASIGIASQAPGVVAPVMAGFSSRGPNKGDPNVLKPDITGPGVSIIAAYTNTALTQADHDAIVAGTLVPGPGSEFLQGTSMSSPHVAGAAALLKQLYPTWSPAAIKSALMTSANGVKLATGAPDLDRWGYGAGHLNPNDAASPGLVYDANFNDYLNYIFGAVAPQNLNLASLTSAALVGKGSLLRRVKNVGTATATYTVSTDLPGYAVSVVPSSVTLAPGASASFEVKLTRTSAAVGSWVFGSLVWSDGLTQVRSPLTVRGTLLAAPGTVADTRAAGTKVFSVGTGYDGSMSATATGLVPAKRRSSVIATGQFLCFDFNVPAGALAARFQLFNSETQGGAASDLDLYVFRGATQVGGSGSGTSDELVDLANPSAAVYSACVDGYAPLGGSATFTLSAFIVGPAVGTQSLKVAAPSAVYLGGTASVGLGWSVASGRRYLGVVQFKDGATQIGSSLVSIDTLPAPALATAMAPVARTKVKLDTSAR